MAFVYRGIEANITESSFHASRRIVTSLFLDNEVFQFLVCSNVSVSVLTALLGVDIDLSGVIVVTAVSDQFADGRGGVLESGATQVFASNSVIVSPTDATSLIRHMYRSATSSGNRPEVLVRQEASMSCKYCTVEAGLSTKSFSLHCKNLHT